MAKKKNLIKKKKNWKGKEASVMASLKINTKNK